MATLRRLSLLFFGLLFAATDVRAFEVAYWVWHRDTPLKRAEIESLQRQGVRTLYWHIGTLRTEGETWRAESPLRFPPKQRTAISIVPVLRLSAERAPSFGEPAAASVARVLAEALRQTGAAEAQLDYDCPDRRLADYATFVGQCRARIAPAALSVTALAGWSRSPAFAQLQANADRLLPMFYDLQPDAASDILYGKALPILDAAAFARQAASWRACKTPWLAGLPNFARVTIFDPVGASRGHLRGWEWDFIAFNSTLALRPQSAPGVTLLRVQADVTVESTPVKRDETVACRWPELSHLARAIAEAKASGAAGVAIFRLPGAGAQSGWSLVQMETLWSGGDPGAPELKLRFRTNALELANVSGADLPPRLAGPNGAGDRGWQLEIESAAGAAFREAGPGEFAHVFAHTNTGAAEPTPAPVVLAQRLTYVFADLRSGSARVSGLLQLAPGADASSLRWRIPGSPKNSDWQSLE